MKVIALCPTYKRLKALRFSVWQFLLQKTECPSYFFFYDESGTIEGIAPWIQDRVFGLFRREDHLPIPEKYRRLVKFSQEIFRDKTDTIYVIWDDDDVYLPNHFQAHVEALQHGIWSKPSEVYSYYQSRIFVDKNTHGRFHGTIAMRAEALERCFWKSETQRWDLDQIADLTKTFGEPVDQIKFLSAPSYCYMWSNSVWHYSFFCGESTRDIWKLINSSKIEPQGIGLVYPDCHGYQIGKAIFDELMKGSVRDE